MASESTQDNETDAFTLIESSDVESNITSSPFILTGLNRIIHSQNGDNPPTRLGDRSPEIPVISNKVYRNKTEWRMIQTEPGGGDRCQDYDDIMSVMSEKSEILIPLAALHGYSQAFSRNAVKGSSPREGRSAVSNIETFADMHPHDPDSQETISMMYSIKPPLVHSDNERPPSKIIPGRCDLNTNSQESISTNLVNVKNDEEMRIEKRCVKRKADDDDGDNDVLSVSEAFQNYKSKLRNSQKSVKSMTDSPGSVSILPQTVIQTENNIKDQHAKNRNFRKNSPDTSINDKNDQGTNPHETKEKQLTQSTYSNSLEKEKSSQTREDEFGLLEKIENQLSNAEKDADKITFESRDGLAKTLKLVHPVLIQMHKSHTADMAEIAGQLKEGRVKKSDKGAILERCRQLKQGQHKLIKVFQTHKRLGNILKELVNSQQSKGGTGNNSTETQKYDKFENSQQQCSQLMLSSLNLTKASLCNEAKMMNVPETFGVPLETQATRNKGAIDDDCQIIRLSSDASTSLSALRQTSLENSNVNIGRVEKDALKLSQNTKANSDEFEGTGKSDRSKGKQVFNVPFKSSFRFSNSAITVKQPENRPRVDDVVIDCTVDDSESDEIIEENTKTSLIVTQKTLSKNQSGKILATNKNQFVPGSSQIDLKNGRNIPQTIVQTQTVKQSWMKKLPPGPNTPSIAPSSPDVQWKTHVHIPNNSLQQLQSQLPPPPSELSVDMSSPTLSYHQKRTYPAVRPYMTGAGNNKLIYKQPNTSVGSQRSATFVPGMRPILVKVVSGHKTYVSNCPRPLAVTNKVISANAGTKETQPAGEIVYPSLKKLLEAGILLPGEGVLSLHTAENSYFASLTPEGLIRATGGEKFLNPIRWFRAVSDLPEPKFLKKETAYKKVMYKGKPLSSIINTPLQIQTPKDAAEAAKCDLKTVDVPVQVEPKEIANSYPDSVLNRCKYVNLISDQELFPSGDMFNSEFWSCQNPRELVIPTETLQCIDVW